MARIYISSTYEDLKDERDEVCKGLRDSGHDVMAMEDYVAADERPLGKCLADVENCDILVGIIAWRYGHRPHEENPGNHSITELEIRHALGKNKACLCFLLEDNVPWAPDRMDDGENRKSVNGLRQYLQDNLIVSKFRDKNGLVTQVVRSVEQSVSVLPHPAIGKLHPRLFAVNFLSGKDLLSITEEKLYSMVTRTDFVPELIVGINQGGTLAAAVLTKLFKPAPMGIVHTQKRPSTKEKQIAYFSLPRRSGQTGSGSRAADIKVTNILVVDAKFKSGSSVVAADSLLRQKYGKGCDIRYGFIIAYGGLNPAYWKVMKPNQPWYYKLPWPRAVTGIETPTGYVAYYTNTNPNAVDPIEEEYRH
jgi:hypoxanthine phosphoribosyltransferase